MTNKTKLFNFFTLALLVLTFAFYSCSNEPDNPVEPESSQEQNETENQEIQIDSNVIVYHLNGGTLPANTSTTYSVDEDVTLAVPEYGDNIFIGWYEEERYPRTENITGWNAGEKSGTVNVYAKWIILSLDVNTTIDVDEIDLSNGVWEVLDYHEDYDNNFEGYQVFCKKLGYTVYTVSSNEVFAYQSRNECEIMTAEGSDDEDVEAMRNAFSGAYDDFLQNPDTWIGWCWHGVSVDGRNVTDICCVEYSESGLEELSNDADGESSVERFVHGNWDGKRQDFTIKTNSEHTQYTITRSQSYKITLKKR